MWRISTLIVLWLATVPSLARADDEPLFRIQNAWLRDDAGPRADAYLNIETNRLRATPIKPGWHSAIWVLERQKKGGTYRLRSHWKPDRYIHMENGRLQAGPIKSGWLSAEWTLERVGESNQYRLRSAWKPDFYIHVEHGRLEVGPVDDEWLSARWFVTSTEKASAPAAPTIDRKECLEWAFTNYLIDVASNIARDRARDACNVIEDLEIAKLLYWWHHKSVGAEAAMALAAASATAALSGKSALLTYAFEAYDKSLSSSVAAHRAASRIAKVDASKLACLKREFEAYVASLSSEDAMDKAIAACE